MTAQPPLPDKWIKFLLDIYTLGEPPILGTVDPKEIEEKAREVMKHHIRAFPDSISTLSTTDREDLPVFLDSGVHVYLWKCRNVLDGPCKQEGA